MRMYTRAAVSGIALVVGKLVRLRRRERSSAAHWRWLVPLLCASMSMSPTRSASGHPVHVSSTQIELSADGRTLHVTVRIFSDDLEDVLKRTGTPVSLARGATAVVDSALSAYLATRFQLSMNGAAAQRGTFIGHEREDDATRIFVDIPVSDKLRTIVVDQRVMFERFDDQSNLLYLTVGANKRTALLRRGAERARFLL